MAFIQYKVTTAGNVGASLASPSLTMTAGNLIVVVAQIGNGGGNPVSGVSDGTNTYQFATGSRGTGGSGSLFNSEIWYAMNITGGTRTVTVTWGVGSSTGFTQVQVIEYSGLLTSGALDLATFAGSGNNTSTVASLSITTSYWNDLIVAGCKFTGSGMSWANGGSGTPSDRTGLGGVAFGDLILGTPGANTITSNTATGSGAFALSVAAFKFNSGSNIYDGPGAGNTGGQRVPVIGSTPSAPNASLFFTSPQGPVNTPTTAQMPFTPYDLVGSLLTAGYKGMPWTVNSFILWRPYFDDSQTWPSQGQVR